MAENDVISEQPRTTPAPLDLIDERHQEQLADDMSAAWRDAGGDPQATVQLLQQFTKQASHSPNADPLIWLQVQFRQHAELWPSDDALTHDAGKIVETVTRQQELKTSLKAARQKGKSRDNWLGKEMQLSAQRHGVLSTGDYAQSIDNALTHANELLRDTITCKGGQISMARNLDGFIAEVHHVNTFNINAQAAGSSARAELVAKPGNAFVKNSVDIQIKDGSGKVVRRYQAKYGADAGSTEKLFENGDYRGQGSLVPEGHAAEMQRKAVETIDYDGVESTPLSKEEAVRQREKVHKDKQISEMDWRNADAVTVGKQIGKTALMAAGLGACFQGGRILARRLWNSLTGKDNASAGEDVQEFVEDSLKTASCTMLNVATSGALLVASRRGFLGSMMKNTPAGRIAMIGSVAVDNLKNLYDLSKGNISKEEALDRVANTTVTTVAGIAAAEAGVGMGAAMGTVFGPVGTFVGGLAGGIIGGMLGSTVADTVYKAGKSVAKAAVSVVADTVFAIGRGVSNVVSSVGSLLRSFW
ncbi:hypothetical protein H2Y54_02825 [Pectobacterium aroidearum]|uniref:hypothetical protein n=1 Tax=Pectobacterium aroidearum TaxID=1201031 RepID=UPI0015F0EBF0|nr:hypothetical protein [Pectobacterium aroidearum]MBA5235489.1 hypothetical protein [Pectobacterium aroidearum]